MITNFTKKLLVFAIAIGTLCNLSDSLAQEAVLDQPASLSPTDRPDKWWQDRHQEKLAEIKSKQANAIQLVFIGDSITHGWERNKKSLAIWNEQFAPYGALNLGYSGDRTEHVLWRLSDAGGEIKGLDPQLYVVMIGTNNTGHRPEDPADETIAGVTMIVDRLLENSPSCNVLLLAVFPRDATADGKLRRKNDEVNAGISQISRGDRLKFLDINDVFLDEKGNLPADIMPDLLHPNDKGYQLWADAILQPIKQFMGK